MREKRFAIHEEGYFSSLQGPEMDLREWTRCVQGHQNTLTLAKTYVFVTEKYVEDIKQIETHVPDLLESTMRPTSFVKGELRQLLFKMSQFDSKISKIKASTVWIPKI